MATHVPGHGAPTGGDGVAVTIVDGIEDVGEGDWQAVTAGRGFYSSPRWLRFLQADPWYDVWYLVAWHDGEVAGALPLYLPTGSSRAGVDRFYDPAAVFVAPAAAGDPDAWRPTLLAGGRSGYDTELLLRPGLPAGIRRAVLAALVDRLTRFARGWGIGACAVMHLTPSAAAELAPVVGTEPLLSDVTAAMHLDGCASFEDLLSRLSSHRRRRIRHEAREFARSDLVLRESRLADAVGVMAPLLATHHARYGHGDSREMMTAHLEQHAEHLGDLAWVLLCEDAGRTVGALLGYEWEGTWYARAVGLVDGMRGQSWAFFNLVYYAPIRQAIDQGVRRYVVGPSTIEAKVARGALLEPRWSLLVPTDERLAGDVRRVRAGWNDRHLARWTADLARIGHEAPTAAWRAAAGLRAGPASDASDGRPALEEAQADEG